MTRDGGGDRSPLGEPSGNAHAERLAENDGSRFDRLPLSPDTREVAGRPTRTDVVGWFEGRFGIDPAVFDGITFWEKGAGQIWAVAGDAPSPIAVETLGLKALRTRQEHWKPTTNAVQRFGHHATRNTIELDAAAARVFVAGECQTLAWDGDWGYLIATTEYCGESVPLGVGLYTHGDFDSMVPKSRRRDL